MRLEFGSGQIPDSASEKEYADPADADVRRCPRSCARAMSTICSARATRATRWRRLLPPRGGRPVPLRGGRRVMDTTGAHSPVRSQRSATCVLAHPTPSRQGSPKFSAIRQTALHNAEIHTALIWQNMRSEFGPGQVHTKRSWARLVLVQKSPFPLVKTVLIFPGVSRQGDWLAL
jgi:hypothetical protein